LAFSAFDHVKIYTNEKHRSTSHICDTAYCYFGGRRMGLCSLFAENRSGIYPARDYSCGTFEKSEKIQAINPTFANKPKTIK